MPNLNNAGGSGDHCRWRHAVQPAIHPVQCAERGGLLRPESWNSTTASANTVAGSPLTCSTDTQTFLVYVNYSPNKLNNISLRLEYFNDPNGQRTGVPNSYLDAALSWQHWLSPQIEIRPEIAYYHANDNDAFNGNLAAGIPPSRNWALIAASDIIIHF